MLKFLGIADFAQFANAYPKFSAEFMQDSGETEAVVIWLKLCEIAVEEQNLDLTGLPYSRAKLLSSMVTMRSVSNNSDIEASLKNCGKLLNKAGVYFAIEPAIAHSKVRGALCSYNGHPAIYISSRNKTHDYVWFTILHEIARLLLHYDPKQPLVSMEDLACEGHKDSEANEYARGFLAVSSKMATLIGLAIEGNIFRKN